MLKHNNLQHFLLFMNFAFLSYSGNPAIRRKAGNQQTDTTNLCNVHNGKRIGICRWEFIKTPARQVQRIEFRTSWNPDRCKVSQQTTVYRQQWYAASTKFRRNKNTSRPLKQFGDPWNKAFFHLPVCLHSSETWAKSALQWTSHHCYLFQNPRGSNELQFFNGTRKRETFCSFCRSVRPFHSCLAGGTSRDCGSH